MARQPLRRFLRTTRAWPRLLPPFIPHPAGIARAAIQGGICNLELLPALLRCWLTFLLNLERSSFG
jgi:hypothetical protein